MLFIQLIVQGTCPREEKRQANFASFGGRNRKISRRGNPTRNKRVQCRSPEQKFHKSCTEMTLEEWDRQDTLEESAPDHLCSQGQKCKGLTEDQKQKADQKQADQVTPVDQILQIFQHLSRRIEASQTEVSRRIKASEGEITRQVEESVKMDVATLSQRMEEFELALRKILQ